MSKYLSRLQNAQNDFLDHIYNLQRWEGLTDEGMIAILIEDFGQYSDVGEWYENWLAEDDS